MCVLSREEIGLLIQACDLVTETVDLKAQAQPNGVDLTVRSVYALAGCGIVKGDEVQLPQAVPLGAPDGLFYCPPGAYLVEANERLAVPLSFCALVFPRSSLVRAGVSLGAGVIDAGYTGRPRFLLAVHNLQGFAIARNAGFAQAVFVRLSKPTLEGYMGRYQEE